MKEVHPFTTIIRRIEHWVDEYGNLHPIAIVDPVNNRGVNYTRVSLANKTTIESRGTLVGSVIRLNFIGGIIPEIKAVKSIDNAIPYVEPIHCPYCGEIVKQIIDTINGSHINKIESIACRNINCRGVVIRRLMFATSLGALSVLGIDETIMTKLVDIYRIDTLGKFFTIKLDILNQVLPEIEAKRVHDYLSKIYAVIRFHNNENKWLQKWRERLLLSLCITGLNMINIQRIFSHNSRTYPDPDDTLWKSIPGILIDPIVLQEKGIPEPIVLDIVDDSCQRLDEIYEIVEL